MQSAAATPRRAAAAVTPSTLTVLHSTWIWLPLTETWLANQLRFLPDSYQVTRRVRTDDRHQPLPTSERPRS